MSKSVLLMAMEGWIGVFGVIAVLIVIVAVLNKVLK